MKRAKIKEPMRKVKIVGSISAIKKEISRTKTEAPTVAPLSRPSRGPVEAMGQDPLKPIIPEIHDRLTYIASQIDKHDKQISRLRRDVFEMASCMLGGNAGYDLKTKIRIQEVAMRHNIQG
mgnify:CR=1 FL=1